MLLCQHLWFSHPDNISKVHPGSRGDGGKVSFAKNVLFLKLVCIKLKARFIVRFQSINCIIVDINVSFCCQTGIKIMYI